MPRALRHRNFALFVGGQIFALIGYWLQQVALSWLVYRLTGSATLLGVLGFAANLPVLLLAPFAGLWSDRFNRHRMMLATQVLEMLQAIALAVLAYATSPLAVAWLRGRPGVDPLWDFLMAVGLVATGGLALLPLLSARWWAGRHRDPGLLRLVQRLHRQFFGLQRLVRQLLTAIGENPDRDGLLDRMRPGR